MTISSYVEALLLTILIEVIIAVLLGYRTRQAIAIVILINVLTHPLLNYLILLNIYFSIIPYRLPFILFLEFLVVLVEWRLLVYGLRGKSLSMLLLSVAMNFCSYITGAFIFGL